MNSGSRFALAIALVIGGTSMFVASEAEAQKKGKAAKAPQRQFNFSKAEREALLPLQTAMAAKNWAAAQAAIPAAQAAAVGRDAKYLVARYQLDMALATQNVPAQSQAIDAIIASGGAEQVDLLPLYRNQGILAANAGNNQKAETAFTRYLELAPNDADIMVNVAKLKADMKKPQEAVPLLERAIAIKKAAGQPVDQSWYRYALKLAFEGKMNAQAMKISRELVAAYPTKENWRDSLLIYRDLNRLDADANLDVLRFLRASKGLAGERDWFELAEGLYTNGNYGEAKAVLDEGAALRMVDLNKPAFKDLHRLTAARMVGDKASLGAEATKARAAANGTLALKLADAWVGYGDYPKAIELYRVALSKGGVDANLVNTRLAVALAQSGDRAGAEAIFKTLTGPRAELGQFWMTHLAGGPAAS